MEEHLIPITNGVGSKELVDGTYNVTATVNGYDASSIDPSNVEITEGVDSYDFTISATGTLTLHVSDDGTEIGVPIVGAKFHRCDAEGNTYGDETVSDDEGNAVFNNVPYAESDAPSIYYKQIASDGEHTFDDILQSTTLTEETGVVEIQNPDAAVRTINLTDANYSGLPIENGSVTLSK